MEKEKLSRKGLPDAPELPRESSSPLTPNHRRQNNWESDTDPFASLYNFREREATFFKSLNESIKMFDSENSFSSDVGNANVSNGVNKISCEDECYEYILPLMSRTQSSIAALLATKDSLDQLDNLHRIVKQLLSVQEQNRQIRKRLRIVKTLHALKSMEVQVSFILLVLIHFSLQRIIIESHKRQTKSGAQFFIVNILKSLSELDVEILLKFPV